MFPSVLLFLKAPRPTFVKTRLAADLGDEKACLVYQALVKHTLSQIPTQFDLHIYFAPADKETELEMRDWLGSENITYHPQVSGDLGQRLQQACEDRLKAGSPSLILLGGDCADLTTAHLIEAGDLLAKGQPVIGPAEDGGYWLLGLNAEAPLELLFQNIPWSTPEVLPLTRSRFLEKEITPHELEILSDIDDLPALESAIPKHPFLSPFIQ